MRPRRLVWQLFPPYAAVTLLALVVISWYVSGSLRHFHLRETRENLQARAELVRPQVAPAFRSADRQKLAALAQQLGAVSGTRLTLVLPSGEVAGDSLEEPSRMDDHAGRPEVAQALSGRVGSQTRFSHTLQKNMMYVAIPVMGQGEVEGVVRLALAATALDETLSGINRRIFLGGLVVFLLSAGLSLWVSRRISAPLVQMREGAERFARGELDQPLEVPSSLEIGALAEAMNRMAAQLSERIRTVTQQRREQEAVLSSMVEGVLAVDRNEKILRLNEAAARLFELSLGRATGRSLQEAVRNPELQGFVARVLLSDAPVQGDIHLHGAQEEIVLQAQGTALRDSEGRQMGALIVLHDISRLRRLESIRKDFVANVSHELKTPVTAIRGSAETLLDGAFEDHAQAERFLQIIFRQSERLGNIIEDLLNLSRIEQDGENSEVPIQTGLLRPVVESAVQASGVRAAERGVRLRIECAPDLRAVNNPQLLEQALCNLIDNAVKYSDAGDEVRIRAFEAGAQIGIEVSDQGCGIAAEHLPRLFERFYRVDKARSRQLGGTGLGLSIVKHIVQAQGGQVEVKSVLGQGSTFLVRLQRAGQGQAGRL